MKTEIWVVFVKNKELYSMWCDRRLEIDGELIAALDSEGGGM